MSSGFVTESELAEARKRRQEEWEKVRTADQPLERPEEEYDGRSLFDRLKEQKIKKDMEYEEAHKLKNLIRGLDDDEVQFLDFVDQSKINAERKQIREEQKELKEFRNLVANLQEEIVDKKIQSEIKTAKAKSSTIAASSARPSQKALLGVGIKRKNGESASTSAKATKLEPTKIVTGGTYDPSIVLGKDKQNNIVVSTDEPNVNKILSTINTDELKKGALNCVAILPGIGPYTESSDSEVSSGSCDEPETHDKYDLVGRKVKRKKVCEDED